MRWNGGVSGGGGIVGYKLCYIRIITIGRIRTSRTADNLILHIAIDMMFRRNELPCIGWRLLE